MQYQKSELILERDHNANLPCDFYQNPTIFHDLRDIKGSISSDFLKKCSNHAQITSFSEKTVSDGKIWTPQF